MARRPVTAGTKVKLSRIASVREGPTRGYDTKTPYGGPQNDMAGAIAGMLIRSSHPDPRARAAHKAAGERIAQAHVKGRLDSPIPRKKSK